MTRFFLSPVTAVESIEASDGLKLTLALSSYAAEPATIADAKGCSGLHRTFTLAKKGDDGTRETSADERLCYDKGLAWRDALAREVTKAVLRQPGGGTVSLVEGDVPRLGSVFINSPASLPVRLSAQRAAA